MNTVIILALLKLKTCLRSKIFSHLYKLFLGLKKSQDKKKSQDFLKIYRNKLLDIQICFRNELEIPAIEYFYTLVGFCLFTCFEL